MKVDVVIIGAGPAGLLLGHLLRVERIDVLVVEQRSADYVLGRIRAGVLERVTTELLSRLGLDTRLRAEGMPHDGFNLVRGGRQIRIDLAGLVGGSVMVYGQTELTRDLMDAAPARDLDIVYDAVDVTLHEIDSDAPWVTFERQGVRCKVETRFIAGCDGFHGPSRQAIPAPVGRAFERVYPFGWLGILADVAPCHHELIYASHPRGFALASMRSRTRSRYYIQVGLEERVTDWPDERLWDELALRLGPEAMAGMRRAPAIEKSIAPLRSFVFEPMRFGSLFLAGDAAHIVPPTGAKGLNLAASDVVYLCEAFAGFFRKGDTAALEAYSHKALGRVWKAERFSWLLTTLMHCFPDNTAFDRRIQRAEFEYIAASEAARVTIAENYVGLPL